MAKKPVRPSLTAATPAAPMAAKFQTCQRCPNEGDCGFEGTCADKRSNMGRPTLYSDALAESALDYIEAGGTLSRWCEIEGHPDRSTVQRWARRDAAFAASLARARVEGTHAILDDAQDISDDGRNDTYVDGDGLERVDTDVVQRSRLRVDVRLKRAAMINPDRYGTKVALTVDDDRLTNDQLDARIEELRQMLAASAVGAPPSA